MIRKNLAKLILSNVLPLFDDTIPPEKLHHFLLENLEKNIHELNRSPSSFSPQSHHQLLRILSLCQSLDMDTPIITGFLPKPLPTLSTDEARAWIQQLPNQRVLNLQKLFPHAGDKLCQILEINEPEFLSFLNKNTEFLLKHIEVKRQTCFSASNLTNTELWLQKNNISILFSRFSRITNDLRFLNTALKLNDWNFNHHQHQPPTSPRLISFILALAEAEYTLLQVQSR